MEKRAKKLLLAALLLTFFSVGRVNGQTLVLHHSDGTTTDVELFLMPRVSFENDKVLVTSPVLNLEYAKEDVLMFTYKGGSLTAIQTPGTDAGYTIDNGQLVFHGIRQGDKVAVYNAAGIGLHVSLSRHGDDVSLPLSSIPPGVYVISVNGRTFKITKP